MFVHHECAAKKTDEGIDQELIIDEPDEVRARECVLDLWPGTSGRVFVWTFRNEATEREETNHGHLLWKRESGSLHDGNWAESQRYNES